HRLARVVVREDGVVVELPRDRDLVLGLLELALELLEVLRRPQLRVGLRDGEEAPERRGQPALRRRLLLDRLRLLGRRPRLGDAVEGGALVPGIALHRLDEVRDQVVAALQLHLDLRPGVLRAVAQSHEPVVEQHEEQPEEDCRRDYDDDPRQRSRILYREAGTFKLGCGGGGGTLVYGIGRMARIARSSSVWNGASRARWTRRSPPAARHDRFWSRAGSAFEARFVRKQLPPRAEA